MLEYTKHILSNGLTVLLHNDTSTPIVAMNILYKVGARNEAAHKTGFAHLFEHLMFGGSQHIENYDQPLQLAGGENNAFTNNDFTNYYLTLPKQNFETACWLESDRMLQLSFSERSLEVQRSVVMEEFKQRYLNQPYGDVWLLLRPLCYKVHPYKWATIGKDLQHIEQATLSDVKDFFARYYHPGNAILCVAGAIDTQQTLATIDKWFGSIPSQSISSDVLPTEPEQNGKRAMLKYGNVPARAIYIAYHTVPRMHPDYYAVDLITDVLSRGKSSRMYNALVKDEQIFSNISAYQLADIDSSLMVIEGKLAGDITFEHAEQKVNALLWDLCNNRVSELELEKIKNQTESHITFSEMRVADKALSLCYYEMLGDASMVNNQGEKYTAVTADDIMRVAKTVLREGNKNVLCYEPKKNDGE